MVASCPRSSWAQYGYCASHSRFFWGLRLHLVATLSGLPIAFALTGAKADERQTLLDIFDTEPDLVTDRPGQTLIGDRHYYGKHFEHALTDAGIELLRPARKTEPERTGAHPFKPLRQIIESINQTFKAQLDLERHGGHTIDGIIIRVLQRILALTAAIWHNHHTGQPVMRSLTAYDHQRPLGINHLAGPGQPGGGIGGQEPVLQRAAGEEEFPPRRQPQRRGAQVGGEAERLASGKGEYQRSLIGPSQVGRLPGGQRQELSAQS